MKHFKPLTILLTGFIPGGVYETRRPICPSEVKFRPRCENKAPQTGVFKND